MGTSATVRLIEGVRLIRCPLNTGFTVYVYIFVVASRLEQSVAHIQNTSTREQRTGFRRERKAAKTIAVILGVAIVCWVPLLVVPRVIASYVHNTTYFTIFTLLQVLSVCNSSINPYIYCVRSRRYYEAFVKLLGLHNLVKDGTSHCCSNLHTT